MRLIMSYVIGFFCLCSAINAYAQSLIVVTDKAHPVHNLPEQVRVIELDLSENLHEQLSANLPDNQQQAQSIAIDRLHLAGKSFQVMMQEALQGTVDAWALGVEKIPAVIVDGHVVYGESDINQAVKQIQRYRQGGEQ